MELRTDRKFSDIEIIRQLFVDGFLDRYTGDRLVYQGVLRLLSILLPTEFPFHPNWKYGASNRLYWDLWPTIDHVFPVSRGGDNKSNWVSCSMLTNLRKSNRTPQERGWRTKPPGDWHTWDGLFFWFLSHVSKHSELVSHPPIKRWYKAAKSVESEIKSET